MKALFADLAQDSRSTAFISDLHLSPETTRLNQQFFEFLEVAPSYFHTIYILGDLFCYWIGDDCIENWHREIAQKIHRLKELGISVYFMPGNRDFLLGDDYLTLSGMQCLHDPSLIELGGETVLLKHGDDLCTEDTLHQLFRRISHSYLVKKLFLSLNQSIRLKIAEKIRAKSKNRKLSFHKMQLVDKAIVKALSSHGAKRLICGHTHQPMLRYLQQNVNYGLCILPDWDRKHGFLYYNETDRFNFIYQ